MDDEDISRFRMHEAVLDLTLNSMTRVVILCRSVQTLEEKTTGANADLQARIRQGTRWLVQDRLSSLVRAMYEETGA